MPKKPPSIRAYPSQRLGANRRATGKRRKPKRRPKKRRLLRSAVAIVCILALLSWLPVLALRWVDPPTTAFMLQDTSERRPLLHEWTPWPRIGEQLPLAVVASEDQKFAEHFGFDLKSIQSSFEDYSDGEGLRGASTISQQVAKNLFLWPGRSFVRKGLEAYFTLLIELSWSKQRILEVYLNIAEFGPGIYGAGAATRHFFDRAPSDVSIEQAALLAAVLPNPKRLRADRRTDYLAERQSWIVTQMARLRREQWITLVR